MINWFLSLFGLRRIYVCKWGSFTHKYDGADRWAGRPIHKNMSVAPPWATIKIVKIQ